MKNMKKTLRRALNFILILIFLAGPLGSPASRVRADAEFSVDGSGFTNPEYDTSMMYFWHEGLPTVTKDKQGDYIRYPVLICWEDKYILCCDSGFKEELNETHSMQGKENDNYVWIGGFESYYLGSNSYSHTEFDRVWGHCDYYMRYYYDTGDSALLSKVGLDVNDLVNLGEAVSLNQPVGLPYLVVTKPETDQYAIGLDERIYGKDVWLVGQTKLWEWVDTEGIIFRQDSMMKGDVQWCLEYQKWGASNFCNKNYTYNSTRTMYDVDSHKSYDYSEGPDQHYWTIKLDSNGKYHFWTMGENNIVSWGRISASQGKAKNRQRLRDWYHANDLGRMSLYYKGSRIGVNGETVKYKDWSKRVNTVENTDGYKVYYADPNLVNFYRHSFTVVKGQVISLEGPLVLDNSCTITVKDGGVLSCSGWVINNGQILVEPGGTLILQERDTLTGDHQYGVINSVNVEAGTGSGRIACDGTIIINRDCKLTCAGAYGLELGSSAQVVNYGQIIAENLSVHSDHIIENRGDTSAVFAGWGVTDSGYILTRTRIISDRYNGKGTREKAAMVNVVPDSVYGDGASRFYVNRAKSIVYTENAKQKKLVSGFTAPIGGTSEDLSGYELPANYPIYFDEEYSVPFIKVGNMIYQYDSMVGRWVNIEEKGSETFFEYRMPDAVEEYILEKLPDGFILADGRVVGQAIKEDVYYDPHMAVFWFPEDMVAYYYEPELQAYIHVVDSDTYFRYPTKIDPPPSYSSSSLIPSTMYSDMPVDEQLYYSGMTEIPATSVKPKVHKEGDTLYFIVYGIRLEWSAEHQLFIPVEGALPDEERYDENGNLRGVTADQVDLNGYDLQNPNAKPKVQKDSEGRYYVIYEGNRYTWYPEYKQFWWGYQPYLFGTLNESDVDLNGYTLPKK